MASSLETRLITFEDDGGTIIATIKIFNETSHAFSHPALGFAAL